MSDNKVTMDQLDDSAVEALSSSVGDVSMLNTENKTIVGALAEIVGKKEIANAIGEPLAETDKFTEMSSEINGLLSTFKTNMMNAGVVVESGDKFKALIDKIKGLTEGEGNKGIQFAEGDFDGLSKTVTSITSWLSWNLSADIGFTPSVVVLTFKYPDVFPTSYLSDITINSLIHNSSDNCHDIYMLSNRAYSYLSNLTSTGFRLNFKGSVRDVPITIHRWIAIGVGEEDTTLRDSLADILENKGVDVTEEDDMASLIGKVDDIVSLPSTKVLYDSGTTSSTIGSWSKVHEDKTPGSNSNLYGSATITDGVDGLYIKVKNGSGGGLRSGLKSNNYISLVGYTKIKANITLISNMANSDGRDWFGIKLYDSADGGIVEGTFSGIAESTTTITLEADITNIDVAKISILGRVVGTTTDLIDMKCTKIWLERAN